MVADITEAYTKDGKPNTAKLQILDKGSKRPLPDLGSADLVRRLGPSLWSFPVRLGPCLCAEAPSTWLLSPHSQLCPPRNLLLVVVACQVTCSYCMTMIPPWEAALGVMVRMLKSGGALSIIDFTKREDMPDHWSQVTQAQSHVLTHPMKPRIALVNHPPPV